MRTVIARIFDSSLDGIVALEGTSFFDFCRILPDDPIQIAHERDFFANADVHIMGVLATSDVRSKTGQQTAQ